VLQKLFQKLDEKTRVILSYIIVVIVYIIAMPAIAIILGGIVDNLLNFRPYVIPPPYNYLISIPLIILCWSIIIWTGRSIVKIGKGHPAEIFNIEVSPVTQRLIVVGPYRWIRNPMATGNITYMFIGLGLLTNSVSMVLFYPIALLIAFIYFKVFEEPSMLRRFGGDYIEYRKNTPMFFPYFSRAKE
jgi:protein-S-isoprenylcysteine O-methyltransferase Ste14